MNSPRPKHLLLTLVLLAAAAWLGWAIHERLQTAESGLTKKGPKGPVPVEVAAIEHGPIELQRTFTGTLEARAEFVVAPKVSGRVEQIHLDLADEVRRGQVVAVLDAAEYVQAVARAEADMEVARASNAEADSLLKIAERELKRVDDLRGRGVSSESQRDVAMAEQLAKQAQVKVTTARIASAAADLEAARIRLGYTQVNADWHGGNEQRVVAERFVDEGETLSANAPLLRIVELDPITAVFFVTERDYARLSPGQSASLATDAYPGESFAGRIVRIAPVFRESTRQARVELEVSNPDLRLKPGMFARATVTLERVDRAVIVPQLALTTRDGQVGVFLVSANGETVTWREVRPGIQQGERTQLRGADLDGRIVVLGQQLLGDGSRIRITSGGAIAKP
ncbi:MAG TPA: efflux RND transporter periplasmic adaptor subunit [Gammaproteobacteria bacterium]|nr:efflux RND transporter periplasmic adaptor subunit [Gammaproteobacteria bacterium]MCP5430201.1 efflux RND transporter periplasmic adaptor subunit [Chromatiaceae bacterium]MCP5435827.1 efflux RND transporter periplasmic adaptor subunit [Chromatiaceae bacterium]HOP16041.1 efflux RND transporter periplasmic adaptor subunit [Gammaproteobacteria bacterium]HPQ26063.1 efflux RND transporter periplasmic adaptor subunit [Gammaproteobacteria bacterium]